MSHDNHSEHHVTPIMTYVKVAGGLYVLTIATVAFHQLHLGALAAPVAFLIATIKAALVLMWFMHLKGDKLMNRVIFGTGFFFLGLFFFFCALDIWTRVLEKSTL